MRKIEVHNKPEFTQVFPEKHTFRIEIITHSGQRHVRESYYAKGHPQNPMTDQEIEAKFQKLMEPMYKAAQINRILDRLWHLEEVNNMTEITTLFKL
jgi:2-methylcitrate dehydratase